ncbi:MAG: hypothetical protein ACI4W2_11390 [Eubacterium sp.]
MPDGEISHSYFYLNIVILSILPSQTEVENPAAQPKKAGGIEDEISVFSPSFFQSTSFCRLPDPFKKFKFAAIYHRIKAELTHCFLAAAMNIFRIRPTWIFTKQKSMPQFFPRKIRTSADSPIFQKHFRTAFPQCIFIHIPAKKICRRTCAAAEIRLPKNPAPASILPDHHPNSASRFHPDFSCRSV